jgi:four helix bundle protein
MAVRRFQELVVWQVARELERKVFAFTDKPSVLRDRSFCDQIRRSSSSAPRNIAEGFGRFWPGEFSHKLHIAVGELEETQDHLEKGLERKYLAADEHLEMFALADRAIGAAVKFIEYLDGAGAEWKKDHLARLRERYQARRERRRTNLSNPTRTPPDENGELPNPNPNPNQNENENENENPNPNPEPEQNREPAPRTKEP